MFKRTLYITFCNINLLILCLNCKWSKSKENVYSDWGNGKRQFKEKYLDYNYFRFETCKMHAYVAP